MTTSATLVSGLPAGYTAEAGSLEAIPEAVACLNACAIAEIGYADLSAETLHAEWTLPGFDVANDVVLVRAGDGSVVGVEITQSRDPHVKVNSWGGTHPAHVGRGLGTAMLSWAAERADARLAVAPADGEVSHAVFYVADHAASEELVANHGFSVERYFNHMVLEFDGAPPEPVIPNGIEIRTLRRGVDEERGALAANEAFSDHYGHVPSEPETVVARLEHWLSVDDSDPSLFWIAWDGDEPAGNLWAWPIGDANPDYGYVGSLGVRRPWRGKGLGRALLLWSFNEFYRRGKTGVELEVDSESLTGALRLYESVGMWTKGTYASASRVIRPGRSLATKALD